MNKAEILIFHPMTKAYLEDLGYICEYEPCLGAGHLGMRDYPDFIAIHPQTGLQLIVECKINQHGAGTVSSKMKSIIYQLQCYRWTANDPLGNTALAILESQWTQNIMMRCLHNRFDLIVIPDDFPHTPTPYPCAKFTDEETFKQLKAMVEARKPKRRIWTKPSFDTHQTANGAR